MSLAQDIRNNYEQHDRPELERICTRVHALEMAVKHDKRPVALVCSKCGTDRLQACCPLQSDLCPGSGTAIK